MQRAGFTVELLVGYPESKKGMINQLLGVVRKVALRFQLIPKTMRGKEKLKRLLYGKLSPLPTELTDNVGEYQPPIRIEGM